MVRTFAAADIGSNTAHLLVAATDGELVMRIDNLNEWIPLGEVVTRLGEIPKETQEMLTLAVKEFKRIATSKKVDGFYVFATEGTRLAGNHAEVLSKIYQETGVRVEIISPAREAELSFRGTQLDTKNLGATILFEVGGGSTQIAIIDGERIREQTSLPLGTGRIIAETGLTNPCTPAALVAAENYIQQKLNDCPIRTQGKLAVASGGVGRGLWRALHADGEKTIAKYEVEYLSRSVESLSVDRIASRFSVKSKRAGTLLPGSMVYLALMNHFGVENCLISEFGVREGAILEMEAGNIKP
jgi:exopolyphosphatase / guanosine-5'-triphosphate,3'-diphosphate pyrophosphatase